MKTDPPFYLLFVIGFFSCLSLVAEENKTQLATEVFSLPESFDELGLDEGLSAQAVLEKHGVVFPNGSSARFLEASNQLEVTNIEEELMISAAVVTLWNRIGDVKLNEARKKQREKVEKKLREIIIPFVAFEKISLTEALKWLEKASVEFDLSTENDAEKGIVISTELSEKIEIKSAPKEDSFEFGVNNSSSGTVTLGFPTISRPINVPLVEAVRFTARQAGLRYSVTEHGVTVGHSHHFRLPLETMVYSISPDFGEHLKSLLEAQESSDCFPEDPFQSKTDKKFIQNLTTHELLEWMGISFPPRSFIKILEAKSLLIVKNSRDQIELVEALLEIVEAKAPAEWKSQQKSLIQSKLAAIQLPDLSFDKTPFRKVIEKVMREFNQLDSDSKIWNRGITIELKKANSEEWSNQWNREITIDLEEGTAMEGLEKLAAKLDWEVIIQPRGVTFLTN